MGKNYNNQQQKYQQQLLISINLCKLSMGGIKTVTPSVIQ